MPKPPSHAPLPILPEQGNEASQVAPYNCNAAGEYRRWRRGRGQQDASDPVGEMGEEGPLSKEEGGEITIKMSEKT